MAAQRDKVVSYRRAEWLIEHPESISLGMCLAQALPKSTTVEKRSVPRGNGQFTRLAAVQTDEHGGHFLHLTVDTPGESASTVPQVTSATLDYEVSTASPPTNREYMDGDAFVYIRDDHVCLCTTATSDASLRYFLANLFAMANIRKDAKDFILAKAANLEKIKLLESQGVSEIELRGTVYQATADYLHRRGKPIGLLSEISKQFKAVLGVENDANRDALRVMLNLRVDGRRNGIELGEQRLETLAIATINDAEDGDDFVIITKAGQRITKDEIYIKSVVPITSKGKSVERNDAWKELSKFYAALESSGALEQ